MIYTVNEVTFNGYSIINLYLLYIIAILLGIMVIISKNPIVSVLFLIGLFLSISGYLILTGLNFIGLAYLLVYVGAVIKRIIRLFLSNHAAWVKISLYKVLLIINILTRNISTSLNYILNLFIYNNIYSTSCPKFLASNFEYSKLRRKKINRKLKNADLGEDKLSISTPRRPQRYYFISKSNKNYYSTLTYAEISPFFKNLDEDFLNWFSGFSDAEGNFSINFYKNKLGNISSTTFRFSIELHIDDKDTLNLIKKKLNIGNDIAVYGNSCKFTVTHPKDIYMLIEIFDKYNLNTKKYLDYLDFKKAFKIYQERIKTVKDEEIFNTLLNLKKGMNSNRTNWDFPTEHNITITDYWLLGLIEGEGSFYLDRSKMEPNFSIAQSNIQHSLIEAIKNYLIDKLGFDKYSVSKLNNSSVIAVMAGKARNHSKPLSVLRIKNTNVLINYFIPYLDKMTFITKKGLDYKDLKIICKAIYDGTHRTEEIKELIIKLSYSMNNYRLSTNSDKEKLYSLPSKDLDKIINAKPTIRHLKDGRQFDIVTGKTVNRRWTNCVFEIIKNTGEGEGEIYLASTLNEAAVIVGVDFRTINRNLALEALGDNGEYVVINKHKIRRVAVFYN